jgi:hypothetical protein
MQYITCISSKVPQKSPKVGGARELQLSCVHSGLDLEESGYLASLLFGVPLPIFFLVDRCALGSQESNAFNMHHIENFKQGRTHDALDGQLGILHIIY